MARFKEFKGRALLFLFFLLFIWFINFSVRILFSPILPILEDEFMVNHAQASGIFTFMSAGYGISVLLAGLFSGRIGYKKVNFVIGLSSVVPLEFSPALSSGISTCCTCSRWCLVFSHGLYVPSVMPLITEYYAEKNWGKAIAIHDTGASTAIFATPLVALGLPPVLSLAGNICRVRVAIRRMSSWSSFSRRQRSGS